MLSLSANLIVTLLHILKKKKKIQKLVCSAGALILLLPNKYTQLGLSIISSSNIYLLR